MFIYSLPILFTHMDLGTPLELLLITLFLYAVLFISTPVSSHQLDAENWRPLAKTTFYQKLLFAWTGQVKLWLVFLPFFIFVNIVLFAIDTLAQQSLLTVSSWDEIHFILATPVIIWTIVVWRNSYNTSSRYWAAATRLLVLSVYFEFVLKLMIRKDYPRIFFQCQEITLDYASCF